MQNFIKTILKAIQAWTKKEIKNSRANWAQNDSSAPDFISNRTHWVEGEDKQILGKTKFAGFSGDSKDFSLRGINLAFPGLTKGKLYTIFFDDTPYILPCEEAEGTRYFGFSSYGGGSPSFYFGLDFNYDGTMLWDINTLIPGDSHTLAIYETNSVYHQIDPRFMSETVASRIELKSKMDAVNPEATGSFSMNRAPNTYATEYSHVEGCENSTSGNTTKYIGSSREGYASHAEGYGTLASGPISHAEGNGTKASGTNSHAEGSQTTASGPISHAEGNGAKASGTSSHAEGYYTQASGEQSHAEGNYTEAYRRSQHVQGEYNIIDTAGLNTSFRGSYAHIVGNGTAATNRSNAHTLDWSGNAWYSGDVYVGSTSGIKKDSGSKKLATEEFVESKIQTTLHLKRKVVEALPDLSLAEPEVIYMVPRPMQLVDNVYDEYMLIDGAWELIGSTSVDLTDYATKEEVEQKAQVQILIWEDDD